MEGLAVKPSPAKGRPRPHVDDYPMNKAAVTERSSEESIKVEGLSFAYPHSDHYLFKSMNLSVSQGEAISLLGPSGCGKSSLLHLIWSCVSLIWFNFRQWRRGIGPELQG